ncbi:hypothetical protein BGZ67_000616 [Mortierella alpina]|nr:hypothetical protein BGZ67_000616 [Mortierella alpina]
MSHPVRGSSRTNESVGPHPSVVLAPLPPREVPQESVADYDLHESDYTTHSPHPLNSPPADGPAGWSHPPPPPPHRSDTFDGQNAAHPYQQQQQQYHQQDHHQQDHRIDSGSAPGAVDLDLGALSLNDNNHTQDSSVPSADSAPLPLHYTDPEAKIPVERTGYADDTRYSGSDQGHVPAAPTSSGTDAPNATLPADSFEPGVVLAQNDDQSSQRTGSVDSTHSAVRAYAAGNPAAATYSDAPPSTQGGEYSPQGGPGGYGPPQPGYGGQEYGYGGEYQQGQQRPPFRGPPQPYGQYPQQDPRYQQQHPPGGGYGPNGYQQGYQEVQYDQYGQPYGPEYGQGQDYYQDQQYQQQQHYGGGGYPGPGNGYEYGGGYRPQGPGYGPPQQQYYGGGPGGPGGANLHSSPSMRGPPPGRGGPRPPMGGPGYGARPPHRGDSGSSIGTIRRPAGAAGAAPRKRPLTIELLDEMRQRARTSNDPAAQLEYAKALIEAAVTFGNDDPDPKRQKKNKEALFMEGLKIIKGLATTGMGIGKPAYPEAQFFLANSYGSGSLGLQIDHDKAFNLYTQASKQNHPAATYRTAVCYELGAGTKRDHSRAVQFYRKAASLGDTAAMYKLGMIILKGLLGQQGNPREAITWLKRAAANADEDNPHALHELGLCFEKTGIPTVIPDEAYSRELFTQAAGYGYAPSQFKLGHCYEYGLLTCPVDPRRSIAWYTRAAEQGDAESELGLSGWYLTGSEGVLKQSDTEAYLWARKAADKGLSRAEYAVGYYSEVGIGVKQDLEEARRWYLRSAAQGNNRAKKRLTDMKKLGAMRRVRPERGRQNGQGPGTEDENCKVM